jgi:hypothetical protein
LVPNASCFSEANTHTRGRMHGAAAACRSLLARLAMLPASQQLAVLVHWLCTHACICAYRQNCPACMQNQAGLGRHMAACMQPVRMQCVLCMSAKKTSSASRADEDKSVGALAHAAALCMYSTQLTITHNVHSVQPLLGLILGQGENCTSRVHPCPITTGCAPVTSPQRPISRHTMRLLNVKRGELVEFKQQETQWLQNLRTACTATQAPHNMSFTIKLTKQLQAAASCNAAHHHKPTQDHSTCLA